MWNRARAAAQIECAQLPLQIGQLYNLPRVESGLVLIRSCAAYSGVDLMTVLRRFVRLLSALLPFTLGALAFAQHTETANPAPPAYLGASERVDGAHIPPFPNAPFSARTEIESTQKLSDGATFTHRTDNVVVRDFRGRTHNEFRAWNTPDGSDPKLNSSGAGAQVGTGLRDGLLFKGNP
jgi:hypothetical protein